MKTSDYKVGVAIGGCAFGCPLATICQCIPECEPVSRFKELVDEIGRGKSEHDSAHLS